MSPPVALVLSPQIPWPLDDGGRIGLWQFTTSLIPDYRVTLVALTPADLPPPEVPDAVHALGIEVVFVPHTKPAVWWCAVQGMVGRWPYTIARYRSAEVDAVVARLVRERSPALALVNHLHLAPCFEALGTVPMVLREHNVEYRWLERYAAGSAPWPMRAYAAHQARRMRAAEAELCRRAALVLAIHDDEARALRLIAPDARIEVVPVGIDFARFKERKPDTPPVVLLAASFAWEPNVDGARRFLEHGWRRLAAAVPEARLRIAGKGLPADLARRARQLGAEPIGPVESMADEFAGAAALLVPLWVGAGARVKIVEAMAARLPVVSTRLGVEGLGLTVGQHHLEAETPEALADALAMVLRDAPGAARRAAEAHAFARSRFSLDGVARRTRELCASVTLLPIDAPGRVFEAVR